jgi:D-tyrosyl-tRNA(Tyr) deacylase
MRIVI